MPERMTGSLFLNAAFLERPAEMGDVFAGAGVPRPIASVLGLISLMGGEIKSTSKLMKPAVEAANILGKTVDLPAKTLLKTVGFPSRLSSIHKTWPST